jgi:hypothetical protein
MDSTLSQINSSEIKALGIFTKSQSMPDIKGFQRVHDFLLQDQSAKLLPKERVTNCLKRRIDKSKGRFVKYNEERCKAHWSNVQRCGSIWTCPVCAKQITEKRREELKKGVKNWKDCFQGGILLLTLTNSHSASHSLRSLISGQKKALGYFFGDRKGKFLLDDCLGREYQVRAFEVTYGQNGWHPHYHILIFTNGQPVDNFFELKQALSKHWINCCQKANLPLPSVKHGLDIRDGSYAEQYVSKWGIESELTKGHIKKGREGGLTPFDLLQSSMLDHELSQKHAKLFQEFGISFKGARQLVWSRGLKKLLEIEEKTDEELSEETENMGITLEEVPQLIFSLLCKYQKRHTYLTALENDYSSGNYGTITSEAYLLIEDLVKREITFIELHY